MFLEVKNLSYKIKGRFFLEDISFAVKSSQIVGVLGPSGSGKTTLLRHIVGSLPSNGNVFLDCKPVPYPGMYKKIGYMFQSEALYEDISLKDNLYLFAELHQIQDKDEAIKRVSQICELSEHTNKLVKHFSGGMKRRLSLAISLINEPSFLILDEPTVGIDPVLRSKFWKFFQELKSAGASIIITTHIMSDAENCDNLIIINEGRIVSQGSPAELKSAFNCNNMDEVYLRASAQEVKALSNNQIS